MPRLRCAFLNCFNLFPVGVVPRAPASETALTDRIDALARSLRSIFDDTPPDLIGLCEVGDELLGHRLADITAHRRYMPLWSGQPNRTQTGIMTLFDSSVLAMTRMPTFQGQESTSHRPHWLAAEFQLLIGNRGAFWFIANHWKSQMGSELTTQPDRMQSAREIGSFFLDTARKTPSGFSRAARTCGWATWRNSPITCPRATLLRSFRST